MIERVIVERMERQKLRWRVEIRYDGGSSLSSDGHKTAKKAMRYGIKRMRNIRKGRE